MNYELPMQDEYDKQICRLNGYTGKAMLTYRRDQVTYKQALKQGIVLPAGDTLIGGIIFCGSEGGREGWINRLRKKGYRTFTKFHDVQSRFALQFG